MQLWNGIGLKRLAGLKYYSIKIKIKYGQQKKNMSWSLKYWLELQRWKRRFLQESVPGFCTTGSDAIVLSFKFRLNSSKISR